MKCEYFIFPKTSTSITVKFEKKFSTVYKSFLHMKFSKLLLDLANNHSLCHMLGPGYEASHKQGWLQLSRSHLHVWSGCALFSVYITFINPTNGLFLKKPGGSGLGLLCFCRLIILERWLEKKIWMCA